MRVTIVKNFSGYRVVAVLDKGAKGSVVLEKIAESSSDAKAIFHAFASHYGFPWYKAAVTRWLAPVLEMQFTTWTRDGEVRHPSFMRMLEDKPARRVKRRCLR